MNIWLCENNFLVIKEEVKNKFWMIVFDVDWNYIYVYVMGFNGFYLNFKGCECDGVFELGLSQVKKVLEQFQCGLLGVKDDEIGQKLVVWIYL